MRSFEQSGCDESSQKAAETLDGWDSPALREQVAFWNEWNTNYRELGQGEVSRRQAKVITRWLESIGRTDLSILDVSCGSGWLEESLCEFGSVVATDLADEVVARAQGRYPEARFVAGDFLSLALPSVSFDVVVSLEVLSHVADQRSFVERVRDLLVPGGMLLLATQNRPVLERYNHVPPPQPGQLRNWVDRRELRSLLTNSGLTVVDLFSVTPVADHGPMRVLNSPRLDSALQPLLGSVPLRIRERLWLGWTLMCRATKP